jgi:hypothetical protein
MVPPNHSWVGVEKYELHPLGQDFRFAIWPASMVHATASIGSFFHPSHPERLRQLRAGILGCRVLAVRVCVSPTDTKTATESEPLDVNFIAFKVTEEDRHEGGLTMASRISCPNGHLTKGISIWEAAVALSEGRAIGVCKKCGKGLHYRIDHTYANDPSGKEYGFIVTRAVRLGTRLADDENYDPFVLVLREIETGKEQILPTFWAYGQSNTQRGGQFPPLLSLEEWKRLFRRLDASFDEEEERIRLRAYELYVQRGKVDGHALDDWLQAEAELTERESLRAAA